jgi:CO/xanthine dehydrogenase Mo-binding subunit
LDGGAEVDEEQLARTEERLRAQADAVTVDHIELEPGIEVNALRITEPLVHDALVTALDARTDHEHDIVQLGVATRRAATEVHRKQFHVRAAHRGPRRGCAYYRVRLR